MIEKIAINHLSTALTVPVYMEIPENPPNTFVLVEKTGSSRSYSVCMAPASMARLLSFPKPGGQILILIVSQFGQDVKTKPEKVYAKTREVMRCGGKRASFPADWAVCHPKKIMIYWAG